VGGFASKICAAVAISLALPSLALAAGLGKLSVMSQLGQPLRAEIEIVSLQRGEGDSLGARLASLDAFRQANVDMNPALLSLKFAVERRPSGQYVMALTSPQPVNEPFVDMLVELNWANGRLVREYTFLLDPPEYAGPKKPEKPAGLATAPAEQAAPEASAAEPASNVQGVAAEPAPVFAAVPLGPNVPGQATPSEPAAVPQGTPADEPTPAAAPVLAVEPKPAEPELARVNAVPPVEAPRELAQEPGVKDTYEVVRGDTLSKIAVRNRVEGVSLQQMLVALFRANPDAFVADNMNRLRAGKIIRIPDPETAENVAPSDARRIVSAQYADFNDYRRSLGIAVASAPTPPGGARQTSGQISPPKEEKALASKEPPKDELRLSRADDAKRGGKGAGTAMADDLAAKDNALKEANERIALLEKNVQDLKNLVEIRNKAAAQAQQQAEAAKAAAKTEPAKAASIAKVEPTKAPEPAKPAEAAKAPEPAKAPAAAKAPEVSAPPKAPEPVKTPEPTKAAEAPKPPEAAKAPEPAKAPEAAKTEVAQAAPKQAPKKAAPPAQVEASFIDDLIDNPMALGGAGGAFLLLAGYAVFKWRRKRSSQFENSIMSVVPSDADSVLGSVGGRNVDTSSSSLQSDFGQTTKADSEEIDPIAEADVYMAYGREAQAEEILRDALAKDSSRQAIRVKLLEIYANRKDTRAFEAAANELRAATGGRGADWEKVAGLGLSIDPGNALYGGKPAASSQLPQGFIETSQMPAFNPPTTAPALESAPPLNIDFDIGTSTSGGAAPLPDLDLGLGSAPSSAPPAGLDFDLGLGADKSSGASPAAQAPEPALSIDFDLPVGDKTAQSPAAAAPSPSGPATELAAIDFDLGTPTGGEPKAEASQAAPIDLAAISLDLGTPGSGNGSGAAPDARWQEVATKLDLAKAYEEMGDKDGARELLKEVVKEGDTAQQQQAQTMLQALG
jgi:pilus assembly protein FimV